MPDSKTAPGRMADVWGGVAATLVAIPNALAYGVATFAALGPAYNAHGATAGLVGAVALALAAGPLTGAPRLITAPCAPAAAVMGALCAQLVAEQGAAVDPARVILLLALVSVLSGAFQVVFGVLRGGTLIKYIPYPVVAGYLSGVGIIIILKQLPSFFGWPAGVHGLHGLMDPGGWQWPAVAVGLSTAGAMLAGPYVTKKVPAAILGLAGGLLAYFGIGFFKPELLVMAGNSLVIGPIGGGVQAALHGIEGVWASARTVHGADLTAMLAPAMTLAVLLSLDTLKTSVVVEALTRSRHDSNKTLLSQGVANLASAFVGGVPGAGTMGATLVNVTSGAQTHWSGIFEGLIVLASFLLLGGLIGWVPVSALAGILLVVGFRMIDLSSFQLLKQQSTLLDFIVIMAVVATAVGVGLIQASGVGILLAALLFIREQMRGTVIRRKSLGNEVFSKQHRLPLEREVLEQYGDQTVVCELQGSLFFGTTDQLRTELEQDLKSCRRLILEMKRVQSVDFTAVHILEQMEAQLSDRGGALVLADLPASLPSGQDLKAYFEQLGLVKADGHGAKVFETLDDALEWSEDSTLKENGLTAAADETPLGLPEFAIFRELDEAALLEVRSCGEERSVAAGETVIHKKDKGDEMFFLRQGRVRVILPLKLTQRHYRLASFGRGDFFGELSFLTGKKRTADVIADTPTELFVLSRSSFDELSRRKPELGAMLFARLARDVSLRLRHTDKDLRKLQDS